MPLRPIIGGPKKPPQFDPKNHKLPGPGGKNKSTNATATGTNAPTAPPGRGHAQHQKNPANSANQAGGVGSDGPVGLVVPVGPVFRGLGGEGSGGVIAEVDAYLARFVSMDPLDRAAVAAWLVAAYLTDAWDQFPHLAITSAEKRCGKTSLLKLIGEALTNAVNASNLSPASLYRLVEKERCPVLFDEAQSLGRGGDESSVRLMELLCAGIAKDSVVLRCVGPGHEVVRFHVYSPKAVALIGEVDPVLADRCLPVRMRRMLGAAAVEPCRLRPVREAGARVRGRLTEWATSTAKAERAVELHDGGGVSSDFHSARLNDMMLPLLVVAELDGGGYTRSLLDYGAAVEEAARSAETEAPGVRLLGAIREVFAGVNATKADGVFLPTHELIGLLCRRDEEPWGSHTRGQPITAEALAGLLRPYGVKSFKNCARTATGYGLHLFADAFARYLPPAEPKPTTNQ